MSRLRLLIGAPASGKSTLCRDTAVGEVVLSLDAARARHGRHAGDQEATAPAVAEVAEQLVHLLGAGQAVTVDATHASARDRAPWLGIARALGAPVEAVVLEVALEVCQQRNACRREPYRVPADVLEGMWHAIAATSDAQLHREGIATVLRRPG